MEISQIDKDIQTILTVFGPIRAMQLVEAVVEGFGYSQMEVRMALWRLTDRGDLHLRHDLSIGIMDI
jgi:DNA-binding transcriptional regulator PaaX